MLISHSLLFLLHDPNQDTYENMKYGSKDICKQASLILIKNGTTFSIMLEFLYLPCVCRSLLNLIYAYTPQNYCDLKSGSKIWGLNRLIFKHIVTLDSKEKSLQSITCSKRCLIGAAYMVAYNQELFRLLKSLPQNSQKNHRNHRNISSTLQKNKYTC